MDCVRCGAPLRPKSNICAYCGAVNDTDLRAIHPEAGRGPQTDRTCPRCDVPMHSLDLGIEGKFLIERCDKCMGIFFDPGELGALIDTSVSNVHAVDYQRMRNLIEEEGIERERIAMYVKCPVCRKLMNRRSYGARSGVITDTCKDHGVWLDGGELGQILKWVKAGGQIHAEKRERQREQRKAKEHRSKPLEPPASSWSPEPGLAFGTLTLRHALRFILRLMR